GYQALSERNRELRGVLFVTSSFCNPCRTKGSGFDGIGCVGHASSDAILEEGKGFSSIGKSDLPVSRLNTKVNTVFATWAPASIFLPSCLTVTKLGGAGKS